MLGTIGLFPLQLSSPGCLSTTFCLDTCKYHKITKIAEIAKTRSLRLLRSLGLLRSLSNLSNVSVLGDLSDFVVFTGVLFNGNGSQLTFFKNDAFLRMHSFFTLFYLQSHEALTMVGLFENVSNSV